MSQILFLKELLDLDLGSILKFSLVSYSVTYKFKILTVKEYIIRNISNNFMPVNLKFSTWIPWVTQFIRYGTRENKKSK